MRYEKKVNGATTSYYYNGTQLLMESKSGERIWYIYGVTGLEGMVVEDGGFSNSYCFDKNILGDVVAIRNINREIVAKYEYDAWGNHTVLDRNGNVNANDSFIGNINPFRYRGYYYDAETGFYYLQTRYYDPSICRFINADNYELVAQLAGSKELNMYAYCNNNPIMFTDETGEGLLIYFLVALTIHDIVLISKKTVQGNAVGDDVKINNSHLIFTPWVQFGYSFYLNHINSDTKNKIKGTTVGVQGEWAAHNLAYYTLSVAKIGANIFGIDNSSIVAYLGAASPADIGATVYNNPKGHIRAGLIAYNIYNSPIAALIDYLVYKVG